MAVHEHEPPSSLAPVYAMLAVVCSTFSRDIMRATSRPSLSNPRDAVDRYLSVSRVVFERPSLDVMTTLFLQDARRPTPPAGPLPPG